MNEIVRDVVQVEQAKTTTGPYQSPNGAGAILEGIYGGLVSGLRAGSRGGGSGSDTNWTDLYKYMSEQRDIYNSRKMGESETRDFQDQTYITAYKKFGASASDVDKVASQVGFDLIQDRAKEQMKRDKAIKARNDMNIYNVGLETLGPEASLDSIMSAGTNKIATSEAGVEAATRLGQLTPQQQMQAIKKGPLTDFTVKAIQEGWTDHYKTARFNDIPEESAMMSYRNMQTNALVQAYNVSPVAAKAIVDKALLPYELTLYGDKTLEDHGLQYYRDAADKAYKSDREIRSEDLLNQFMNQEWEWKTPGGSAMVKGDVIISQLSQDGSQGSTGGAARILSTLNATNLIPQMASKLKSRYGYDHMRLLFSADGADLAEILADNSTAEKNINDGRGQALQTAINESNSLTDAERRATKSYFQPQKMFNESFMKTNGEALSKEAFKIMKSYESPEVTNREVDELFRSIATESNAATSKNGFYYLTKSGQLKYYGMVGQRLKNLLLTSGRVVGAAADAVLGDGPGVEQLVQAAESLKDLTNSGRLIETGDTDAVIMRENIPEIRKTLDILKDYYDIPEDEIRERFNRSQIRNTEGGQRARSLQIFKEEDKLPGAFFDDSFTFTMTDRDADRVIEDIDAGNIGEAFGMSRGTAETLKAAGRTVTGAVGGLAYAPGMAAGAGIASLTGEAKRARSGALLAGRELPEVTTRDVVGSTFGDMSVEDKLRSLYNAEDDDEANVQESNGRYTITFTDSRGNRVTSIPQTAEEIDESLYQTFGLIGGNSVSYSQEYTQVSPFEYSGNIDLENRPVVHNEDGSISTERSIVIEEDGEYVIIPTVVNGEIVSDDEAVQHYHETGEHHGKYKTVTEAVRKSEEISREQAKRYLKK